MRGKSLDQETGSQCVLIIIVLVLPLNFVDTSLALIIIASSTGYKTKPMRERFDQMNSFQLIIERLTISHFCTLRMLGESRSSYREV